MQIVIHSYLLTIIGVIHLKLPNGFGTVYKLSGNRRRPYVVKKTIQGRQKPLGYFDSYESAIAYLVDYNRDPALLSPSKTLFSEVYSLWRAEHFPKISESAKCGYANSYRHCQRLHAMTFVDIRLGHLQAVIDDIRATGAGHCTQKKARSLMEQLYKYAAKYDLVTRDYARYVEIDRLVRKFKKRPFTVRQRNKLWRNIDTMPFEIKHVLMLMYTGTRVGEYINIKKSDVKLRRRFFKITRSKTQAGLRIVPIPKKLLPYWQESMETSSDYICCRVDGSKHTYDSFRRAIFDRVMQQFNFKHTPHETRHTLASMLDSADTNKTVTKLILGHAREGVTEKDYTHKTIRELLKAIDKVCR